MDRRGKIGLGATAVLSVAFLAACLTGGPAGERILAVVAASFPVALYLPAVRGRRSGLFLGCLLVLLLGGLGGILLPAGQGAGASRLLWILSSLWLAPLIVVSVFHTLDEDLPRLEEERRRLRERFGAGEPRP